MLLRRLSVKGFRCFEDVTDIPFHRLSVFIGENDSGKTALLHALELLLTGETPTPDDYRRGRDGSSADSVIEISGEFELEGYDTVPADWRRGNGRLVVKKTFAADQNRAEVDGNAFVDGRWSDFAKLAADDQKKLLEGIGEKPGGNKAERVAQFEGAHAKGVIPRTPGLLRVDVAVLGEHLPRFERVASSEYNHPDSIVQRTLRRVVDEAVRPVDPATGQPALRPELRKLSTELKEALDKKVAEMQTFLASVHPKVKEYPLPL